MLTITTDITTEVTTNNDDNKVMNNGVNYTIGIIANNEENDRPLMTETTTTTSLTAISLPDALQASCCISQVTNISSSPTTEVATNETVKKEKSSSQSSTPTHNDDEDDGNSRRRSSRLKTLEARKEQERTLFSKHKDSDENSGDSCIASNEIIESKHTLIESPNNISGKQKKKKAKKEKNKSKDKNKDKDRDSEGKKKRKKKHSNDKINSYSDQNYDKFKTQDMHKNSNPECFTAPLPPSHYANIKNNHSLTSPSNKCTDSDESSPRPEKVKTRWRRNSELEFTREHGVIVDHKQNAQMLPISITKETEIPPEFDVIDENIYLFERRKSKSKKETRRMVCDCILTKEERMKGLIGCGDDCLNRMLMIECGSRCALGDHCANKRFQKRQCAKVEPFRTANKGWGLRALEPLQSNSFIMEYIGEVIDPLDFHNRTQKYSKEKREHHFFMALKSDEIIDATVKGNITRFINHSCDPNSETQKWTINGELRIGFFTQRCVQAGEEITFDYQFQRYGKEAQKCFCESFNCRGYIGATEGANILTDGSRITNKQKEELDESVDDEEFLEDLALEEEIAKLSEGEGLRNRQQVLTMARLMVRAEDTASRIKLIDIIKGTIEMTYLRLLLDYHGLQLLWSWMVEVEDNELKSSILELLEILPIPNKTMLTDSKVYAVVERWAQQTDEPFVKSDTIPSQSELPTECANTTQEDVLDSKDNMEVDVTEQLKEGVVCDSSENSVNSDANTVSTEQSKSEETTELSKPEESTELSKSEESTELSKSEESTELSKPEESTKLSKLEESTIEENETIAETLNTEICSTTPQEIVEELKEEEKSQNEIEMSSTNTKSSPRIEFKSSSFTLVIKPRSQLIVDKSDVSQSQTIIKSKPSIAAMAQKLLLNWKDLKEVFRIPRLERQKRHEDEKEADRKTLEVEERRAKGLPLNFDKRNVDDRDYTIAGILGTKRKGIKRLFEMKDLSNKRTANVLTPNQMLASNWNKVSKEEHRKMFEMEVAQKDYQEALKRYHQQLAYYNAVYGQHIQAQQQQQYYLQEQYVSTYGPYDQQYYPNDQNLYQQSAELSATSESYDYNNVENESMNEFNQQIANYDDNNDDYSLLSIETTPTLIPLANFDSETYFESESTLAIDNLPHNWITYNDISKPDNDKKSSIFDPIYPPPGVFYETIEGKKYFTPLPIDRHNKAVNMVFDNNITIPFAHNWTKLLNDNLAKNWKHKLNQNGDIYYYNKTKHKSQWIAPKGDETDTDISNHEISTLDNDTKFSDNEDLVLASDLTTDKISPKLNSNLEQTIFKSLSIEADSADPVPDNDNAVNSTHSSPNLLQSILALEADPRKRRQMLNSVMPSTTTAAADTSSSSKPKKYLSTRQIQENFRNKMSEYVVHCLNQYRRTDCKKGRIVNNNDFKYLARKLTHTIMGKEIKQCKSLEHLSCSDAVKHKTKDYVKKYMARFGPYYKTDNSNIDKTMVNSPKDVLSQTND
ncbi:histone-lysine N-methyltransferase SETD2-like [Oppia nitens]|uniref:histone-lysine N-methyltransferase SETD2-like n=1 Tax=Oppia nitens TaxID=1686743 RepID=UPI0023D9A0B6|nr:histone-lysine N-methyltransferase SETD2-like [Oppia nitens]